MRRAAAAFAVAGLLISVPPASGHPFGGNHGAFAAATAFGGFIIPNSNGVLAVPADLAYDLNVPTTCGPRYTTAVGCTVLGANARPLQVVALSPALPASRGDFHAVGVYAGCAAGGAGCTGSGANGSYNERVYTDGWDGSGYYSARLNVGPGGILTAFIANANGVRRSQNNGAEFFARPSTAFLGWTAYGVESASTQGGGPLDMGYAWAVMQRRDQNNTWFDVTEIAQTEPHAPACRVDAFAYPTGYGAITSFGGAC